MSGAVGKAGINIGLWQKGSFCSASKNYKHFLKFFLPSPGVIISFIFYFKKSIMNTCTESTRRNILFAVMLASFLTPFAGSALSAALPDVGRAYGAGPDSLAWILQSFLLGCIVFMLPVGKVTEKVGCRLVFMAGMAVFVISALIAPLQTEYAGFLASRALQGLGSAMIFATNNSILSLTFPPEKRGFAMGWNISMVFLGSTLGPCVGGLANFYFGWRSIFWIFAAVGSLALAFSFVSMRDPMRLPHTGKGADWIGIVLYGLSMLLTMGGLAEISRCDWAVWAFTGGIVLAVLLVVLERRVPDDKAVLPTRLFSTNRMFAGSTLAAVINFAGVFAELFLVSLYLQSVLGFSSREAGLILLLHPLPMCLLSPLMGSLSDRVGCTRLCCIGMAVITLGLAAVGACVFFRQFWPLLPALAATGVGSAFFGAPNNSAIMGSVNREQYGIASAMLGAARLVGQSLSKALAGVVLTMKWPGLAPRDLLALDIIIAFAVMTVLTAIGIFASALRQPAKGPAA